MIIWDLFSGDNTVYRFCAGLCPSAPCPVRVRSLRFISIDAPDENHRPLTGFRAIVEPKPALQRVDVLDT